MEGEVALVIELVRPRHEPGLHHHHRGEVAEAEGAIGRFDRPAGPRLADRHPFVIGLERGGLARAPGPLRLRIVLLGPVLPAVVGRFVVVPLADPGGAGVGGLQVRVGLVEGMAGPVVVQRHEFVGRDHVAPERIALALGVGRAVLGVLVDVVAEMDHRVDARQLGDRLVDVEDAALVVRAAQRDQHQVRYGSLGQGARPARHGELAAELEAIEIGPPRLQTAYVDLHGEVPLGAGVEPSVGGHTPEAGVLGHRPAHDLAPAARLRRHPCPDDQTLLGRIAGGDAMAEGGFGLGRRSNEGNGRGRCGAIGQQP